MIKLFVVIGIAGVSVATYFSTIGLGPDFQMAPSSSLYTKFQKEGLMPDANAVFENDEVEHSIFEVPEEDARQLEMAMSNMKGMDMGGMKMEGEGAMKMPMADDAKTAMKTEGEGAMKMPMADEAKTAEEPHGAEETEATKKPHGAEEAKTAKKPHGAEDGKKAESGLKITQEGKFDREVVLTMAEWKFSNLNLGVKKGEKIRFTITNEGKIPHEFMFMSMAAMQAVNYRANRADWNLLEHEAVYEKSLVLPGGKFSFVAEIQQDGAWMFMCMLPYHMQMGMMGQIATPGRAMNMGNMQM